MNELERPSWFTAEPRSSRAAPGSGVRVYGGGLWRLAELTLKHIVCPPPSPPKKQPAVPPARPRRLPAPLRVAGEAGGHPAARLALFVAGGLHAQVGEKGKRGGRLSLHILLLVSPYSWLEDFTPRWGEGGRLSLHSLLPVSPYSLPHPTWMSRHCEGRLKRTLRKG